MMNFWECLTQKQKKLVLQNLVYLAAIVVLTCLTIVVFYKIEAQITM